MCPPQTTNEKWPVGELIYEGNLDPQPFRGSFSNIVTDITLEETFEPLKSEILGQGRILKNGPRLSDEFGDFNLEKDVRKSILESPEFSDSERRKLLGILSSKFKKLAALDKRESISRYLEKKKRRKYVCQIKYKIRQDLACRRLRVKGKFVKSSKMDLITAANILLISELTRRER